MTTALHVLLVEDSEADAKLTVYALRHIGRPLVCERVEDAEALRSALLTGLWEIIICDWSLPKLDAPAALALVKELRIDLPFIIVSGTIGEASAVEAMRSGAHDFLLKGHLARLVPAVERELREKAERDARRIAEQALRRQDARFRALVEKSEDIISMTAADGTLLYASPAMTRVLGYPVAEVIGRNTIELIHPDDRQRAVETLTSPPGSGMMGTPLSYRILHRDGSYRWMDFISTNLIADPEVAAIVSNARDITEKKRNLDELRASEARYRRIIETTNEGVWTIDSQQRTTFMNSRMAAMLGYDLSEVVGRPFREFLTDENLAKDLPQFQRLRAGASLQLETRLKKKDGSETAVLLEAAGVVNSMGQHEADLFMVMDINERLRVTAALRESEAQLRQVQKMEAVGKLAGGVAHDFNNMLSVIIGYSELIQSQLKPGDPIEDSIAEICKAATRGAGLTRQLLLFSRQQVLEPRILDLNEILLSAHKMLERLIGEDIDLVSRPAPALGSIKADQGSIEQVILNLAVNARDAMETGGTLTIETANVVLDQAYAEHNTGARPGPHVMLAVSDTGTGMSRETQSRMFEPFFTTKKVGQGTGLGLSTIHGIVQQSNGSIWVHSEEGKGTTFKIYLPRADATANPALPPTTLSKLKGTETILLVEDEEPVRIVASSILRRYGYQVLSASTPIEALQLCQQHSAAIRLVLSDVVMPQMSGPELEKRIHLTHPGLKFLFMSGYTDESMVRHGILTPGVAFIQKPFMPVALAAKVRAVLDAAAR